MKIFLLVLFLNLSIFAGNLELKSGFVSAHTEMMMDSNINPINSNLFADIDINGDITTISGKFWVEMNTFVSENSDRDESMHKNIEVGRFKVATYTISKISKSDKKNTYVVYGRLNFHGISRDIGADAEIFYKDGILKFRVTSMILMSDYGVEMPCMVFMCVRDRVDLVIEASFN